MGSNPSLAAPASCSESHPFVERKTPPTSDVRICQRSASPRRSAQTEKPDCVCNRVIQYLKQIAAYAATALAISFFTFNAPAESSASLDFAKNASKPPRWSTVRNAALEIRQEPTAGTVFGVADIVARHRAFSSQFATARHVVILVLTGCHVDRPLAHLFSRA